MGKERGGGEGLLVFAVYGWRLAEGIRMLNNREPAFKARGWEERRGEGSLVLAVHGRRLAGGIHLSLAAEGPFWGHPASAKVDRPARIVHSSHSFGIWWLGFSFCCI